MSQLRLDTLPPATAAVMAKLADEPALAGFGLVGGTAMALQAGHRRSLDIDLIHFGEKLDKNGLHNVMRRHGAVMITPQSMISAAKINGLDLLAQVQDYVLDGVKVRLFVDPLTVDITVADIYRHFETQVQESEIAVARRILGDQP